MYGYTTRVELHNHKPGDYDRLHVAMALEGFTRTIVGNNGQVYHLPTAEYDYQGIEDGNAVLGKATLAASTLGLRYAVIVSGPISRHWVGLEEAKAAPTGLLAAQLGLIRLHE